MWSVSRKGLGTSRFCCWVVFTCQTWWVFPADHKTLWLGGCSGCWLLWAAPGAASMRGALGVPSQLFRGAGHLGVIVGSAADQLGGLLAHSGSWSGLGTRMVQSPWALATPLRTYSSGCYGRNSGNTAFLRPPRPQNSCFLPQICWWGLGSSHCTSVMGHHPGDCPAST